MQTSTFQCLRGPCDQCLPSWLHQTGRKGNRSQESIYLSKHPSRLFYTQFILQLLLNLHLDKKNKQTPLYVNPQNLEVLGTPSSINSDGCSSLPKSGLTHPSSLLANWEMFGVLPWSFPRQTFKCSFVQQVFVGHPLRVIMDPPPRQGPYDASHRVIWL